MTFSEWQAAVLSNSGAGDLLSMEKRLPGAKQTYPLLVEETIPTAEASLQPHRWSIRVVTTFPYDGEKKEALLDGGVQMVDVGQESRQDFESAESCLELRIGRSQARLKVDLNILRNISEIKRMRTRHPEIHSWILVCEYSETDEPEALVAETIRQMTGVLAGCEVIEIRQGERESFQSLWGRLNVARLLMFEGELERAPDAVAGASFFTELSGRLENAN